MPDRTRRLALRIAEWLAYIVGGVALLGLGAAGLRLILARTALPEPTQWMIHRLAIAAVAGVVLVAILLPDLLAQIRRMRRRK